ncbi:G-type lectin S-receptor-like serine/threonine-protein kinase At4g11900 [Glycine max]|nr:G-type lectin S-receptor-like serine/threonine-protein kinase At4g11900 [Glycine max]
MITISKFEYEYLTNHAASVEEIADKKVAAAEAWIEALKASEKEILMETKIAQRQLKESKLEQELELTLNTREISNASVGFCPVEIDSLGRCVNNNQRLLIVNVYAPCDLAGKRVLWDELRQLRASNPNGLWCFLGDFNSIRSPEERISLTQRSVDSYDISAFNQWISDMELQEIKCVEYAYTLKVDEKNDVYSFGVVLLELLTGRRPVGNFGEEGLDIVQWTKLQTNWSNDKVVKILDERLCHIPLDEAKQVYFVAMLCVQEQSVERPTMREVVEMLAQAKKPNTFQKQ